MNPLALMAIGLLLAGCAAQDDIAVGLIAPLSGSAASYGIPAANGVILAAEEINAAGGINGKRVRLVVEDGACDPKKAADAANKLVHVDNVRIILTGCSTESFAAAPLANERQVIQMAFLTTARDYTDAGDYSFRVMPSSDYFVGMLARAAYGEYGSRKVAILHEQKEFPSSVAASFKEAFEERGGTIVSEQEFSDSDFRSVLLRIASTDADAILFQPQGEDAAIQFYRQLEELGLRDRYTVFTATSGLTRHIHDHVGAAAERAVGVDLYIDPQSPRVAELLRKYEAKHGGPPQANYFYVAGAYDAVYLLKHAIGQCGDDTACMQDALQVDGWSGASGTISIDENGDALTAVGLHSFHDGQERWRELR